MVRKLQRRPLHSFRTTNLLQLLLEAHHVVVHDSDGNLTPDLLREFEEIVIVADLEALFGDALLECRPEVLDGIEVGGAGRPVVDVLEALVAEVSIVDTNVASCTVVLVEEVVAKTVRDDTRATEKTSVTVRTHALLLLAVIVLVFFLDEHQRAAVVVPDSSPNHDVRNVVTVELLDRTDVFSALRPHARVTAVVSVDEGFVSEDELLVEICATREECAVETSEGVDELETLDLDVRGRSEGALGTTIVLEAKSDEIALDSLGGRSVWNIVLQAEVANTTTVGVSRNLVAITHDALLDELLDHLATFNDGLMLHRGILATRSFCFLLAKTLLDTLDGRLRDTSDLTRFADRSSSFEKTNNLAFLEIVDSHILMLLLKKKKEDDRGKKKKVKREKVESEKEKSKNTFVNESKKRIRKRKPDANSKK
jgi:hypothetical protein